ncbi:MAG: hypothetical protein WAL42_00135 [Nitrososphaeraceae archaeon]|jgi:hypothetical protein
MDSVILIEALGLVSYDNTLTKCNVQQILLAKEERDGLRLVDRPENSKIDN